MSPKNIAPIAFLHALSYRKGVNNEIPSILLFIEQAIEKTEEELARLRKAHADLSAAPDRRRLGRQAPSNSDGKETSTNLSIGKLLMEALSKNGPLTVKDIHRYVTASGKIAQYHTVSAMVSYYFKQNYIKKLSHGLYAIADESRSSQVPVLTNGAPIPKEVR